MRIKPSSISSLLLTTSKLAAANAIGQLNQGISELKQDLVYDVAAGEDVTENQNTSINKIIKRKRRMARSEYAKRARSRISRQTKISPSQPSEINFNNKLKRRKRQVFSLTDLASSIEERLQLEQKVDKIRTHWSHQFQELEILYTPEVLTTDTDSFNKFLEFSSIGFERSAGQALNKNRSPLLQLLNPYGCHCNFEVVPSPFTGEPVNEFDAACKVLQDGYRCIGMDNGQQCSDNAEDHETSPMYLRQHDKYKMIDGLEKYCQHKNTGDTCGYDLCMVEGYFVNTIFNLLQSGKRIDLKKSHRMGFDPMTECQVRPAPSLYDEEIYSDEDYYYYEYEDGEHTLNTVPRLDKEEQFKVNLDSIAPNKEPKKKKEKFVPDMCCGKFPERQPFNPGSAGQKDCCQKDKISAVFNTITHMCCADGNARKLGEC